MQDIGKSLILGNFFRAQPITIVMGTVHKYKGLVLGMALLGGLFSGVGTPQAAPIACEVTSDKDVDPATSMPTPGSFRMALIKAMGDGCIDKKIIFKIPKVRMNAPLGTGMINHLKGITIEPDASISTAEIFVNYDKPEFEAGCSAPSPFSDCFAYLPTSSVSIRNIKITVDPAAQSAPLRGLCIDKDEDAAFSPSDNQIVLDKNEFNGFSKGGVAISYAAYGVKISQTTFHNSGAGIVIESDPNKVIYTSTPPPPIMGGSNEALFAILDTKGAVMEYHLRGLSVNGAVDQNIVKTELFESDGKAGNTYVGDCTMYNANLLEGKWNIECVLPATTPLPFHYAVTVTSESKMTSMFSTGTIPADVHKVPAVTPSTPQAPVEPPKPPIVATNPPAYQEPPNAEGNITGPLSLSTGTPTGGCSLIR